MQEALHCFNSFYWCKINFSSEHNNLLRIDPREEYCSEAGETAQVAFSPLYLDKFS